MVFAAQDRLVARLELCLSVDLKILLFSGLPCRAAVRDRVDGKASMRDVRWNLRAVPKG